MFNKLLKAERVLLWECEVLGVADLGVSQLLALFSSRIPPGTGRDVEENPEKTEEMGQQVLLNVYKPIFSVSHTKQKP